MPVQTVRTYDATTASQPVVKIEPFNQPSSSALPVTQMLHPHIVILVT